MANGITNRLSGVTSTVDAVAFSSSRSRLRSILHGRDDDSARVTYAL